MRSGLCPRDGDRRRRQVELVPRLTRVGDEGRDGSDAHLGAEPSDPLELRVERLGTPEVRLEEPHASARPQQAAAAGSGTDGA